jgi:hypothetical protein
MTFMTLLLGCPFAEEPEPRLAEVVDACDGISADLCVPCTTDEECVLDGNPCRDTVACFHRDSNFGITLIGCDPELEYTWPDAAGCQCDDDAICRWSE